MKGKILKGNREREQSAQKNSTDSIIDNKQKPDVVGYVAAKHFCLVLWNLRQFKIKQLLF